MTKFRVLRRAFCLGTGSLIRGFNTTLTPKVSGKVKNIPVDEVPLPVHYFSHLRYLYSGNSVKNTHTYTLLKKPVFVMKHLKIRTLIP